MFMVWTVVIIMVTTTNCSLVHSKLQKIHIISILYDAVLNKHLRLENYVPINILQLCV